VESRAAAAFQARVSYHSSFGLTDIWLSGFAAHNRLRAHETGEPKYTKTELGEGRRRSEVAHCLLALFFLFRLDDF